ncbi:hypothetical protein MTR_3g047715 [Medicago truncatula]|uniref:DUF7745 domain-containing protein n=1 Tax=Medicago truncatula TaxID=3880 RepID=A0A072UVX9_MEDTR|nr:hypothetical protein MTR_3g047715 [Medicago truncatula]
MYPATRSTKKYYFRNPDLSNLRKLGKRVTNPGGFRDRHGRLLNLLEMKVVQGILDTLVQFYDSYCHCFTFIDYQLVPTLEEYSYLIGLPVSNEEPFNGLEPAPKHAAIAKALHFETSIITAKLTTKGGLLGLPAKFLFEKATAFADMGSIDAFESVLALLIYGLMLFPDVPDFVNVNAIKIFLAKNPVPTLLADTYHSIHDRTQKGQGTILCCAPLLYKWFTLHLPDHFKTNPENTLWSQKTMSLAPSDIVWYNRCYDTGTIIDSCGEFPNVPLLGICGGINYNPILARRQFGYPMEKPKDISLDEIFYLNKEDSKGMRGKFIQAWRAVYKREKGQLGRRSGLVYESYTKWVIDRAAKNGIPFPLQRLPSSTTLSPSLPMTSKTKEEAQYLLAEMTREKDTWRIRYMEAESEIGTLRGQVEQKDHELLKMRQQMIERDDLLQEKDRLLKKHITKKQRMDSMDLFDGPDSDFED